MWHGCIERRRILDLEGVGMYQKKGSILSYQHKNYMHSTPITVLHIVTPLFCSLDQLRGLLLPTFEFPTSRGPDILLHQWSTRLIVSMLVPRTCYGVLVSASCLLTQFWSRTSQSLSTVGCGCGAPSPPHHPQSMNLRPFYS